MRRRGGRKRALGTRKPMVLSDGPNQRWSLDFVNDAFTDGRRFRILTVIDDFTRENIGLVTDTSLSGQRVARELGQIVADRGMPNTIVSDNGTEFTSMAILKWVQDTGVDWHYIAPGKPQQNGFIESFNGKLRDECLNENLFSSLFRCERNSGMLATRLQPPTPAFSPRKPDTHGIRREENNGQTGRIAPSI